MKARHVIILEKDGKRGIKDISGWSWLDTEMFIIQMKNEGFAVTLKEGTEEEEK